MLTSSWVIRSWKRLDLIRSSTREVSLASKSILPRLLSLFWKSHPIHVFPDDWRLIIGNLLQYSVHTIAGGNNFNQTQSYASSLQSTCTTASITLDKSNYWTPQLYFWNQTVNQFTMIPVSFMNSRLTTQSLNKILPILLFLFADSPSSHFFFSTKQPTTSPDPPLPEKTSPPFPPVFECFQETPLYEHSTRPTRIN